MKKNGHLICKDCPKRKFEIENTDQLINLTNMYLSEWSHRDSLLWKQVFSYFIACLVVMVLPFMTYFGIDFGNALPKWIFPSFGIALTLFFYIVSKGYVIRLKAIGETYQKLIDMLPIKMQRTKTIEVNPNVIFNISMSNLVVNIMFIALLAIGIMLLHISLF